jgi:hypothetical protein
MRTVAAPAGAAAATAKCSDPCARASLGSLHPNCYRLFPPPARLLHFRIPPPLLTAGRLAACDGGCAPLYRADQRQPPSCPPPASLDENPPMASLDLCRIGAAEAAASGATQAAASRDGGEQGGGGCSVEGRRRPLGRPPKAARPPPHSVAHGSTPRLYRRSRSDVEQGWPLPLLSASSSAAMAWGGSGEP